MDLVIENYLIDYADKLNLRISYSYKENNKAKMISIVSSDKKINL